MITPSDLSDPAALVDAPPDPAVPDPSAPGGLPLVTLAAAIHDWEHQPDAGHDAGVLGALGAIIDARGATGGWIELRVAPWPVLAGPIGRPGSTTAPPPSDPGWIELVTADGRHRLGRMLVEGPAPGRSAAVAALRTGLELAWARTDTRMAQARLDALDAATAAITAELSVDRVLQVIVDRVRPLVAAQYAALGILGEHGGIDRFITSGIDEETRRAIGHPPRGQGILGIIIREGESLRLADLQADPRSAGFPPNHPSMHSFLGVPVTLEGRPIGNLYLTDKQNGLEFSVDDQRLVETFARHAGIAIQNARLHEELRTLTVLQERERIGQDLHDGIIQALYAVGLSLEDVGELMRDEPADAEARIEAAIEAIHCTIRDIRNFIFGLRPELLEDVDLGGGLANLVDEFRRSTLLPTDLVVEGGADLDAEDAVQLLQLTREALSNVARHADAQQVRVDLRVADGVLRLVISDDGCGFDPTASRGPTHHGLSNMRARAETLGGTLTMDSRPAGGTRISFEAAHRAPRRGEDHDR